jgi:putative transposase
MMQRSEIIALDRRVAAVPKPWERSKAATAPAPAGSVPALQDALAQAEGAAGICRVLPPPACASRFGGRAKLDQILDGNGQHYCPDRIQIAHDSKLEFCIPRWDDPFVPKEKLAWPHAPTHQLSERGTYFVTAGTYHKHHHFRSARRLAVVHRGLLKVAQDFGWTLEAWAVFSNHYHFVAKSPRDEESAESLAVMLTELHKKTSDWVNGLDATKGRRVWYNFWDTQLSYQPSYLARLNYVHQNAVRHGLVSVASQYPWCSARWFEREASAAKIRSIYRFKIDQVKIFDEFEPHDDW